MKILNAYHLKIIALVTMIVDHLGMMFFPDVLVLRFIGRVAFVLYAFMLVEGFFHSKDIGKYIRRVFIWAVLSEIPFDLAMEQTSFYPGKQNIFFTLLIGLVGMYFINKEKGNGFKLIFTSASLLLAFLLKVDYSWYGVALTFTFYYLRNRRPYDFIVAEALSMIASVKVFVLQFFAFLGFIPIAMYNGKPGRRIGTIYYSFYAVHLLMFAVVKHFLKN
ncbi:MAG: TraX family protein [Bergeyella sp.]